MANAERLWATYRHIEAHPETWDQSMWHCGTSFCFAGHGAVTIAGAPIHSPGTMYGSGVTLREEDADAFEYYDAGDVVSIQQYAQVYFDLTGRQAEGLFSAGNSLSHIKRLIEMYTDTTLTGV